MPIGMAFWVVFLIWVIFGFWSSRQPNAPPWGLGSHLVIAVLLFLLGWAQFGFVVK
jgi:O-antigen ligase